MKNAENFDDYVDAIKEYPKNQLDPVCDALNTAGACPWTINTRVSNHSNTETRPLINVFQRNHLLMYNVITFPDNDLFRRTDPNSLIDFVRN